jgi:hypothetical protein
VKGMGSGISQPVVADFCAPGELVVRRGACVRATGGPVGRADEFLMDPTSRRITHLVRRASHLWSRRDVIVPVSEIRPGGEGLMYLKLDRNAAESLPMIPARQWHGRKAARVTALGRLETA